MPDSSSTSGQTVLTARLNNVLRAARAECATLPNVPEIDLLLLNADFSSAALSAQEMQAVLNYPAYWAFCWASGQMLARYLLDNRELVRNKTVLDFGCGSGVVAIAAAKAGAARVIACDLDDDALLATQYNAALNDVQLEIAKNYFDVESRIDLIIAADILYDRANLIWPSRFLQRAPQVLIADSRIRNFAEPGYKQVAELVGSTWPDLDEFDEFRVVKFYCGGKEN
ncbi:MAG: protein methyltransferase [Verrucomicrobiaceae bacterium]|nr:protein methyltransferase [Verrucomicrobiaceae bacterium]